MVFVAYEGFELLSYDYPERRGVPAEAIIWLALAGGAVSLLPCITELVAFGSFAFLGVFGLVNLMHVRHSARALRDRALGVAATAACATAALLLVVELARPDRVALGLIAPVLPPDAGEPGG